MPVVEEHLGGEIMVRVMDMASFLKPDKTFVEHLEYRPSGLSCPDSRMGGKLGHDNFYNHHAFARSALAAANEKIDLLCLLG